MRTRLADLPGRRLRRILAGEPERRQPQPLAGRPGLAEQLELVPPLPAAFAATAELHAELLGDAERGNVGGVHAGDNAGQAERLKPVSDKEPPSLRGQAAVPVGAGEVVREIRFAG